MHARTRTTSRMQTVGLHQHSSDLLQDFCRGEAILQSFTLPASPQQNEIAERRVGLVMEVARTSMIDAAAPHFPWPFAVRYAAHQLNLWLRVSLPETSPTLRWTGKVSYASVFRIWGSRAFVRDTSADKLSSRAIPNVFLGFPLDVPGWRAWVLPPHLALPPLVDPLPPKGPAPSGVSQVDLLPLAESVEVTVDSGAARGGVARGGASRCAASRGVEPAGAEPWGAEPEGAEPGGAEVAELGGAETEGAEHGGAGSEGAESEGAEPRASLTAAAARVFSWRTRVRSGAAGARGTTTRGIGAGGAGANSPRGAGVTAGAGGTGGVGAAAPGGARTKVIGAARAGGVRGTGAGDHGAGGAGAEGAGAEGTGVGDLGARGVGGEGGGAGGTGARGAGAGGAGAGRAGAGGAGAGGTRAGGAGAGDPGAGGAGAGGAGAGGTGAGGTVQWRPFLVPPPSSLSPPSWSFAIFLLQPDSPVPAPFPYAEQTDSLIERREPESRPSSPVRTGCRAPHPRPPPVPGTHIMTLRLSSLPLRVSLPSHLASSLADGPDPESDKVRAASTTFTSLLATAVTDPSFESTAASALVAELCDCPPSVGGECALGTDVLEDRQEEFECLAAAVPHLVAMLLAPEGDLDAPDIPTPRSYTEAITGPYSSKCQIAMDVEMASWKSSGTYVDAVPPPGANIVDGMWIFRNFSSTPKMTTLRVLLHVAAQRDYELHSLDFSTAFLQGSLHEEIWLRRPPGFTRSFPTGTQWSPQRPVYGIHQVPREWHDTLRTTLAALGFAPSTADPSLFLRTDTLLPPFYILMYVDDLVFATTDTEALALVKSELQKRHTCNDLGELRSYLGLQITRDRARCTITLIQSHMVHQVLQRFSFWYSSPQSSPLPTGHSLSAPPSDESVEPSGPYPELVDCLMYLMTCTGPDLAYLLSILARYVAPGSQRPDHWEAAKRVLRYLCSTSGMGLVLGGRGPVVLTGHADASWCTRLSCVLSSCCEAEIYVGAMAAQELRWLPYLPTDLGERPCSLPVLYIDNKAMIALCQEHKTKHIALRYFLARELQ
ncbi:unnamed protein product [Closterium sp. NIES-53]